MKRNVFFLAIIFIVIACVFSSACIDGLSNKLGNELVDKNGKFDPNVYVLTDIVSDVDDKTIVSKTYNFAYNGNSYVVNVNVPRYRINNYQLNTYKLADIQKTFVKDEYLVDVVNQIKQQVKTNDKQVLAEVLIAFVQIAIVYEYDLILHGENDYWAYPVETLINGAGDCDCKGILLTALLRTAGYDALILFEKNHLTSIVSDVQPYNDKNYNVFVEHNGKKYYIVDATSKYGVGYYSKTNIDAMKLSYTIPEELEFFAYSNQMLDMNVKYTPMP